jgi:broad-specificity NMP kinase
MSDDIVIEGFTEKDFLTLQKILENYKASINDVVSFEEIVEIYKKVIDINDFFKNK